jgi:hypothetical protein
LPPEATSERLNPVAQSRPRTNGAAGYAPAVCRRSLKGRAISPMRLPIVYI